MIIKWPFKKFTFVMWMEFQDGHHLMTMCNIESYGKNVWKIYFSGTNQPFKNLGWNVS